MAPAVGASDSGGERCSGLGGSVLTPPNAQVVPKAGQNMASR